MSSVVHNSKPTSRESGVLFDDPLYTGRLIVTDRDSESTLAIMHSPRSADSDCRDETARWVRAAGSRPSRRPAPVLACRHTHGYSSLAISNGNGEDPMVLERPIRGFDSPPSGADDQNPVALRYEVGGLRVRSFHRFVSLLN